MGAGQLVRLVRGGAKLGNDAGGFRDEVLPLLGLSQRECFRREDDGIVMAAAAAITFCKAQPGVDRLWFFLDDMLKQLFALVRVSTQHERQPDKQGASG